MSAVFVDRSIGILEDFRDEETYLNEEEIITVLYDWALEVMEGVTCQREFGEFRFLVNKDQAMRILRFRKLVGQNRMVFDAVSQYSKEADSLLFWLPQGTRI